MQNRYNAFNQIHKALRAMLYDTAIKLQRTDLSQPSAEKTIAQLELVLTLFEEHAGHEDKHVLPMVFKHNPQLAAEFENDHEVDHKLGAELSEQIEAWKTAATDEERALAGNRMFYAFNEFIAFNLYHMNREEDILLKTMWLHYSDEDILSMQAQIIQSIPPNTMMIQNGWMLRSLNNPEISRWLEAVKNTAPWEAYAGLLLLAEKELEPERYASIREALLDTAEA